MDEIGRGTSTFDGLALAGAIAHHLHEKNRAFTLFATHYFELTEFPLQHARRDERPRRRGRERRSNEIAFLHEIEAGPASRSYGVQVARLAGMPATLLRQARAALERARGRADRAPAADRPVRCRAGRGRGRRGERGRRPARAAIPRSSRRWPRSTPICSRPGKRSKRSTASRPCNETLHDLLRSRQARRRPGLPLRLAHQRRARPDRHLPQDDGLRAAGRPLHGACCRPATSRSRSRCARSCRSKSSATATRRRSRSGTRPACSTPRASSARRCAASTIRTARRSRSRGSTSTRR